MGQNLTGKTIASTYEDLVQISGSFYLTNGTGSEINNLSITASHATFAESATSASYALTASYASNVPDTASFAISASHADFADSSLSASYATTSTSASHAEDADNAISASYAVTASYALNVPTVDTGSLMVTGSVNLNTLTFTKGDGSTFNLTVDTGSATTVDTGSLLVTASISDATITFTKGDATTFPITVNNVSNASTASVATSASYAQNASTANVAITATSASHAVNADSAISASYATNALSASYAPFTTPNLQEVTNQGNTTNNTIIVDANTTAINRILGSGVGLELESRDDGTALGFDFSDSMYVNLGSIKFVPSTGVMTITSQGGVQVNGNANTATSASHAVNADTASVAQNIAPGLSPTFTDVTITNDLTVNGTASIAVLNYVTGSATYIGDSFIVVNTDLPAQRYAGLAVYDSGSSPQISASLEWDGETDVWILKEETGNTSAILTGPTGSKGAEVFPTINKLQKGLGWNYLGDSSITDDGTTVSIATKVEVTGSVTASAGFSGNLTGNASTATSASHAVNANNAISASYATSASFATTALSASYAPFTTPNLQDVTNAGSSTNNNIIVSGVSTSTNIIKNSGLEIAGTDNSTPLGFDFNDGDLLYYGSIKFDQTNGRITLTSDGGVQVNGSASFATNALSSSYALTASYAENSVAPFPYTGSAQITGSLAVTGSITKRVGALSGSLIDNITDVYTTSAPVEHIVSLTQAEYNLISGSADPNTLYYITDAVSFVTSASYAVSSSYALSASYAVSSSYALSSSFATTASFYSLANVNQDVVITGSVRGNVSAVMIGSNTASLDFSAANFFDLTIVSGSNTYIQPTNIAAGQTVNLKINQPNPGNGTVSFPSLVKQVSGSAYVPTTGSGATDILTFIAFDSSNVYLSNVKNLI